MRPPPSRLSSCEGKVVYPSHALAVRQLEAQLRRHTIQPQAGYQLGTYLCPYGRHYHIGHQKAAKKDRASYSDEDEAGRE